MDSFYGLFIVLHAWTNGSLLSDDCCLLFSVSSFLSVCFLQFPVLTGLKYKPEVTGLMLFSDLLAVVQSTVIRVTVWYGQWPRASTPDHNKVWLP